MLFSLTASAVCFGTLGNKRSRQKPMVLSFVILLLLLLLLVKRQKWIVKTLEIFIHKILGANCQLSCAITPKKLKENETRKKKLDPSKGLSAFGLIRFFISLRSQQIEMHESMNAWMNAFGSLLLRFSSSGNHFRHILATEWCEICENIVAISVLIEISSRISWMGVRIPGCDPLHNQWKQ